MNSGGSGIGRMDDPEDRLPWLESADDDYREGPSPARLIVMIVALLALLGLAAWAFTAYRPTTHAAGSGALIEAPPGDYKTKPEEPGGMKVDGEGDTVFSTSEGEAPNGAIDTRAVPEVPVAGKTVAAKAQDKGSRTVVTAVPAAAGKLTAQSPQVATARIASSGGGGAVVQLGSFPSEAGASLAWNALSKRFAYLAPLGKSVEKAEVNGNTVYRLRVNAGSNGAASALCGKLKVAGEACFIPN